MLLDPLVDIIETLKERIRDHEVDLRASETRTRMALIDPLLSALGWDTSDPAVVTPEYTAGGGRADYALLGPDGKPAALIEAKKLGEALEPHQMQMLNYSNAAGIGYAGLTNGSQWELYEVFKQAPKLVDRRVLNLSIADSVPHRCALELLQIWRPNLASGSPTPAKEPILTPLAVDEPPPKTPGPVPGKEISPQPSALGGPEWTPISQVSPQKGATPPSAIRMNQGAPVLIKYWNRVLIETAEWLCQESRLTR